MDALGFFSRPFHKARAIDHLAPRFGEGLAHFRGDEMAQIIGMLDDQVMPFLDQLGALENGRVLPRLEGFGGGVDRVFGPLRAHITHLRQNSAIGGTGHFDPGLALDPGAIDEGLGLIQRLVLEAI